MNIEQVLDEHKKWLDGTGGCRANLCGANLSGANLRSANLHSADLSSADLSGANLSGANLRSANLHSADLYGANLRSADLSGANIYGANIYGANLCGANLRSADLHSANLRSADLRGADLYGANLRSADLRGANLSGAKGLLSSADWLLENFEEVSDGLIVYKAIGETYFKSPEHWEIKAGAVIEDVVNSCRTDDCGCGVNFATLEYVKSMYKGKEIQIWKCLLKYIDLAGTIVPYNTDGKARCARLTLVETI